MRELTANSAASNFPLAVVSILQAVVPVWELVDSVARHAATDCLPLIQN